MLEFRAYEIAIIDKDGEEVGRISFECARTGKYDVAEITGFLTPEDLKKLAEYLEELNNNA